MRHLRRFTTLATILAIGLGASACTQSPEDILVEIRSLQGEGRIEESIPLLIELIDAGNRDGEVMYRYGRALSLTGQPGRGIWALDTALEDPDWFVQASHQIADDAYIAKNQELVLETLERLRAERTDEHSEDLAALLLELRVRIETRRQYEEALELAETILDDYPDEEQVIRLKAAALIGLKQTDEAYELIREAGILASGLDPADEETPEGEASPLDLDLADPSTDAQKQREAYWCTVRATFKREAGEPDDAQEVVDECLERFPSDLPLVNEAIKLYSQLNRYDRVLEILVTANEEQPANRELRLALVQYLDAINDTAGAEAVLRKAVEEAIEESKDDKENWEIVAAKRWVDLGSYLVDHQRQDEALEAFDEALVILGERASPGFLFRHADALILAGRYDDALAIAERTPIEVHTPMIRGRVAFERGEFEQAIEQLDKAALLWPDNAPIRYYLARSAEGIGDFDRAIEEYRQAMRADPNLSAARERLARLHLAEGRVRHASTILTFVSPREASEPSVEMKLLEIEARSRLGMESDLAIPPTADHPIEVLRRRAIQSLARGVRLQSDARTAAELLAAFEKESKGPTRSAFFRERVSLLLLNGDVEEALTLAKQGATKRPGDVDIALALGRALAAQEEDRQEIDVAEGILKVVLEAHPKDLDALTTLGDLAKAKGDPESAGAYYERALEASSDHWEALSPRLEILFAEGKREEALDRLHRFVDVDNPYHGGAALELARKLGEGDETLKQRITLARRAIRFGAGTDALDYLKQLDPEAAAEYQVQVSNPGAPGSEAPGSPASGSEADGDAASPSPPETEKAEATS